MGLVLIAAVSALDIVLSVVSFVAGFLIAVITREDLRA